MSAVIVGSLLTSSYGPAKLARASLKDVLLVNEVVVGSPISFFAISVTRGLLAETIASGPRGPAARERALASTDDGSIFRGSTTSFSLCASAIASNSGPLA